MFYTTETTVSFYAWQCFLFQKAHFQMTTWEIPVRKINSAIVDRLVSAAKGPSLLKGAEKRLIAAAIVYYTDLAAFHAEKDSFSGGDVIFLSKIKKDGINFLEKFGFERLDINRLSMNERPKIIPKNFNKILHTCHAAQKNFEDLQFISNFPYLLSKFLRIIENSENTLPSRKKTKKVVVDLLDWMLFFRVQLQSISQCLVSHHKQVESVQTQLNQPLCGHAPFFLI